MSGIDMFLKFSSVALPNTILGVFLELCNGKENVSVSGVYCRPLF